MHSLAPSTLASLPHATHRLADLETAFQSRRRELAAQAWASRVSQPTMRIASAEPHAPGYALHRAMPRDGRGRFLSRAWLTQAETFTATDLAWFRHPVGGGL